MARTIMRSVMVAPFLVAQNVADASRLGCTALAIDGAATTTGQAFATENTDCNNCDFRLTYVAPRTNAEGATRPVYMNPVQYPRFVGASRSEIYLPQPGQNVSVPVGYIPEVPYTFGYYESISPLMNDQGLGMGESSCSAMLQNKPPGSTEARDAPTGIIDAMAMMQLALERCATARCAIKLMGELGEKYGYLPYGGEPTTQEYLGKPCFADSGEGFTLADATGEAWVMNMMGGVSGVTKAVWAAQRVPKGHMAVVANEFTMGYLPTEPNDDFMFSPNLHRAARVAGLWDGEGEIHFTRVFAPDPTLYNKDSNPPIPLYTSVRRWGLFTRAAPSLGLEFNIDHRKYGFSVEVERSISHRDVMNFMKEHYAGTEFDMTKGILAGPYETPFRVEGGPAKVGQPPRGVSILRTLYSTITASGPSGSLLWYAPDTPLTSVYIPLDPKAGMGGVAQTYQIGYMRQFDRSAAWWAFDFVNNWMQMNYKGMSTEDVYPHIEAWQDHIDKEVARVRSSDHSTEELAKWQVQLQKEIVSDWWQLADRLIMKWNDMSRTDDKLLEKQVGYPEWWAELVGFSNDVHPVWVQPASRPETSQVPGYVSAKVSLPRKWDQAHGKWTDWTQNHISTKWTDWADWTKWTSTRLASSESQRDMPEWVPTVVTGLAAALVGFALGRRSHAHAKVNDYVLLA